GVSARVQFLSLGEDRARPRRRRDDEGADPAMRAGAPEWKQRTHAYSRTRASHMMAMNAIQWGAMAIDEKWEDLAKGLLKAELKRRNMTYADLVGMLKRIGVKEDEHNLRNKVARGKFTAAFFLQCLSAIGVQTLRLE